ncbi:uncharacterized protein BJ171DRAFT_564159 [Polychytrium aggregatum]|uniref:uncharacterized protein n=1 Tax=Polychytrium aggregatum TaxID=110093 RepID=UPI0022FE4EB0|nr:uncharacterized protein BJ171DRAFT_564159 [Polychytrium aggregatum]KAI9209616.1 hypothetical protein BJ171DRAFT_564159 [Polychytrium aggregatum]
MRLEALAMLPSTTALGSGDRPATPVNKSLTSLLPTQSCPSSSLGSPCRRPSLQVGSVAAGNNLGSISQRRGSSALTLSLSRKGLSPQHQELKDLQKNLNLNSSLQMASFCGEQLYHVIKFRLGPSVVLQQPQVAELRILLLDIFAIFKTVDSGRAHASIDITDVLKKVPDSLLDQSLLPLLRSLDQWIRRNRPEASAPSSPYPGDQDRAVLRYGVRSHFSKAIGGSAALGDIWLSNLVLQALREGAATDFLAEPLLSPSAFKPDSAGGPVRPRRFSRNRQLNRSASEELILQRPPSDVTCVLKSESFDDEMPDNDGYPGSLDSTDANAESLFSARPSSPGSGSDGLGSPTNGTGTSTAGRIGGIASDANVNTETAQTSVAGGGPLSPHPTHRSQQQENPPTLMSIKLDQLEQWVIQVLRNPEGYSVVAQNRVAEAMHILGHPSNLKPYIRKFYNRERTGNGNAIAVHTSPQVRLSSLIPHSHDLLSALDPEHLGVFSSDHIRQTLWQSDEEWWRWLDWINYNTKTIVDAYGAVSSGLLSKRDEGLKEKQSRLRAPTTDELLFREKTHILDIIGRFYRQTLAPSPTAETNEIIALSLNVSRSYVRHQRALIVEPKYQCW